MTHTYNEHAWVHASQRGKNCNDELSKEDKSGQPFHTSIRLEYRQTDDCAGKNRMPGSKGNKRGCHDGKERENGGAVCKEMVGWLIRGMRDERGSRSSR